MGKHTQGPWRVEGDALRGWEHRVTAATLGNSMMRLTIADIPNAYNLLSADPEIEANAILIAASPLMYEALEAVIREATSEGFKKLSHETISKCLIALAEAKP